MTAGREKRTRALRMIAEDMESDVAAMEGRPFSAAAISEIYGNLAAAIAVLAKIVEELDSEVAT